MPVAQHWIHLQTTNPIESTFSTMKLRTKVTRGVGSPAAALAMVSKLAEAAQARWRAVTAPHLVALVRSGARFEKGRPSPDAYVRLMQTRLVGPGSSRSSPKWWRSAPTIVSPV